MSSGGTCAFRAAIYLGEGRQQEALSARNRNERTFARLEPRADVHGARLVERVPGSRGAVHPAAEATVVRRRARAEMAARGEEGAPL